MIVNLSIASIYEIRLHLHTFIIADDKTNEKNVVKSKEIEKKFCEKNPLRTLKTKFSQATCLMLILRW